MTRYIDVELAIKDIQETYCKPCKKSGDDYHGIMCRACWVGDCICIIDDCEEADVKPVVHAYWIHAGGGYDGRDNFYHCSICGRTINMICGDKLENYPYCHCGAKMDEK